jgi:predicted nucleotidyltransferase
VQPATTARDAIQSLQAQLGEEWPSIVAARAEAREHADRLRRRIAELKPPSNTSIVAFGSLAREEWTTASDIDWTLMVDGPSDMHHFTVTNSVADMLKREKYGEPGQTGAFGQMSSSHELVHHIGGSEDTNHNMTRRILLLLESTALSDDSTHERVIRAVLERYIAGDPSTTLSSNFHVPLFLFNDVVRFWRTMTVDYVAKKWRRFNAGWALRNIKLRMSRKLLFAKGMLICFLCDQQFAGIPSSSDRGTVDAELLNLAMRLSRRTAIDLLADTLEVYAKPEVSARVMGSYNNFIATLDDVNKRHRLETLDVDRADDPLFEEQRRNTGVFRDGLQSLFFESNEQLTKLTKRYGVF